MTSRIALYKGAKADVPVLVCNPNLLKDDLTRASHRADDGTSRLHFPPWLGIWFWDEWPAEWNWE
ncbi:terminase gpA endonuclease subunit [Saccharospirillum alexandrii]|uniref:terminase gpA endonuclease subunit n=1 Tax=Saccharospirillum alexandrii TaxID=2448477 RepID=UPI003736BA28